MTQALDGLWTEICDNVRQRISTDAFQRWFSPTRLIAAGEDALTLAVPNMIHQLWIESNYATTLQDAIVFTLGDRRAVRYHVDATAARPAVNQVAGEVSAAEPAAAFNAPTTLNGVNGSATPAPAPDPRAVKMWSDLPKSDTASVLNANFLFETFVVGPSNQFAHAAAYAVAENPARIYNPLFIHGGVGLGKTHLMQAIGHHISQHRRKAKVVYVSSEHFTNEFIDALQQGTLPKFRKRYRQADVLLIDDVQFFAEKARSQEEFFHTFNALFDGHRQIVLTSDGPPSDMSRLESRLVSRFEWGITAEMQPPDVETRTAILRKKMTQLATPLPEEIVEFLATHISNNVRRLEGALMRVASFSSLAREKLTLAKAEELLRDLLQEDARHQVTIDQIQRVVAEYYDVRLADMTSKRRPACIAFPRQIAMSLARELTNSSFAEIGMAFGGRDHGTVMHACKLVASRMGDDARIRSVIMLLEAKLKA